MFQLDPDGVYRSDFLSGLPGLQHGFASRNADDWPGDYTRLRQVHSSIVVPSADAEASSLEGDALIGIRPKAWIGIRTADCVPVLLADPVSGAVAAVHAGWRGTAAEILTYAVEKLTEKYWAAPSDLVAAIGPAIGACCYEVGPDVARLFPEHHVNSHVDLKEANRLMLVRAGVPEYAIDVSTLCTRCEAAHLHSYRRDGDVSGRMVAAIRWPHK